ncbi:MAG: trypsin-like serine protease [Pseudomonadota bacterium]
MAQTTDFPDTGDLTDNVFLPRFSPICASGFEMSEGCQAIRNREIVDASEPPWRAVGRVNYASINVRSYCTGTLVSDRVVVTAAHCLYNFARKIWIPPKSIRFAAGYQRGSAEAVSSVDRYVMDPVNDPTRRDFLAWPRQDWAILILSDPIGAEVGVIPPLWRTADQLPPPDVTLAGYSGLREHVLSLARDCGTGRFDSDSQTLVQFCSAMSGDSGAPIIATPDGKPSLAAILTGVLPRAEGFFSVGIPVANFEAELRATLNATR